MKLKLFGYVVALSFVVSPLSLTSCNEEAQYSGANKISQKKKIDKNSSSGDGDATGETVRDDNSEPTGVELPYDELEPIAASAATGTADQINYTILGDAGEATSAELPSPIVESTISGTILMPETTVTGDTSMESEGPQLAVDSAEPMVESVSTQDSISQQVTADLEWHSARYVKANNKDGDYYKVKCRDSEIWMGVKYENKNDGHVEGIYCGTVDGIDRDYDEGMRTAGLAGKSYNVNCDDDRDFIGTGIYYDDKDDDHTEGVYCSPVGIKKTTERWITLSALNTVKDFQCEKNEGIFGINYDDNEDRHLAKIRCGKMERSAYVVRKVTVDNKTGDKYNIKCASNEAVVGVDFDGVNDDHVEALFCATNAVIQPWSGTVQKRVDNLAGSSYSVECGGSNGLVGIYYDDANDDHTEGLHCSPLGVSISASRWISLDDGDNVCNQNEIVTGVQYDDKSDDSITKIFCGTVEPINYSRTYRNVDNKDGSFYDVHCNYDEVVVGFKYDGKDDDHVTGIHCGKLGVNWKGDSIKRVKVDSLSGDSYNVGCGSGDAIVGIYYDDSNDDHLEGLFCADTDLFYSGSTRKLNVSGSSVGMDFLCNQKEVIDSIWYDDSGDKHLEAINCAPWLK